MSGKDSLLEELARVMESKVIKGSKYPPFIGFEKEGDYVLGKFISTRKHPLNPETPVITIRTLNGEEYSVTLNIVLQRLFEENNITEGMWVYIRYAGKGKTKHGRPVKLFDVAAMTEEEFLKIKEEVEKKLKESESQPAQPPTTAPQPPPEQPTSLPLPPLPEQPPEKEERIIIEKKPLTVEIPLEEAKKIREFFKRLFEFYEKLPWKDFEARAKRKFPNFTPEQILVICEDFLAREGDTVKLKG